MRGKRKERGDPQVLREDALRPCPFLGFDHDQLGCYLVERGAFELAEAQFGRAVWLNPYEPSFRLHWAVALIKLERRPEARDLLHEILRQTPTDPQALELWRRNWPDEALPTPKAETSR